MEERRGAEEGEEQAASVSRNQTLKVWDMESGHCLAIFTGESAIPCCALASDGLTLVAGESSDRINFTEC